MDFMTVDQDLYSYLLFYESKLRDSTRKN